MKTKFYLAMAAAALFMSNCSQEEALNQVQGGTNTLTATIEGASRSAVTDAGVFSWTSGDEISVYNGEDFTTFTLSSGNAFTSSETIIPSGVAIYPASTAHDYNGTTTKVNLATAYNYGSTNAPMVAAVTNTTLAFKHVGGLMRFIVKGMPSTATSFTFTANTGITGDFEVSDDIITATTASESNKTVTINFTAEQYDAESMTFYIPLPTGTYEGYTVSIGDSQDMSDVSDATVKNTIVRGTLLLMPTFTYDTTNGLSKGIDGGVVTLEGGEQALSVSGTQAVEVDASELGETEAVLNLNYTPAENSTLTLSESGDETESQEESTATVSVSVPTETTVATLDITMPSMTVELNVPENGTATYTTVNALTAQNTLKIGKGVSVGTLNIKGGHIRLSGSITTVNRDENNADDVTYIILEDDVEAPANLPDNVKIVTAAEWDLRKAIEKADAGSTVTLENDVELTNQLTITKSLTLNLNGNAISNTTDIWNGAEGIKTWSLISVQGEGVVVTVKGNGTLQAKNGDCYAIDVRYGATVNLEDGTYVGNISAVYAINNATANIKGGTYSIQQKSEYDDYRYLLNLKDNSESSIVVTGGTFVNYDPANSNGENPIANLVASGYSSVADENNYVVSEGIKNEKALIAAIAGEDANATITLADNIVLTKQLTITKSLTLNLNDKTISNTTDIWNDTEGIKTWSLISVQGQGVEVTVKGNGTLQAKNGDCYAIDVRNGAIVTLEDGTYVGNISAVYAHEGTANINGGIYKIQQLSEHGDHRYVVNCLDENYTETKASIVVKGGQFYSFNPSDNLAEGTETNFVAEGYTISEKTENETTIYTVSESEN